MPALIIEPDDIAALTSQPNTLLVDISSAQTYVQYHIPGAVFLNFEWIIHAEPPRMGLLPSHAQLENVFSAIGIGQDTHVIAYDDEGGGRACRLLWTLDCVGHSNFSLLNGGLQSWSKEGHEVTSQITWPTPAGFTCQTNPAPLADRQYILDHLNHKDTIVLDTRTPQEYAGIKVYAQRGGHIPGAVNIEWTECMDKSRHLRLKPDEQLRALFGASGIDGSKEVIAHCQSHHRSAHTYIVLKHLGFEKVRGYPGSWSDWGNDPHTPIES